jgi:hypothetical protein
MKAIKPKTSYLSEYKLNAKTKKNSKVSNILYLEWATSSGLIIAANVVLYDYTKLPNKAGTHTMPSGHKYVVPLSRSEKNEEYVLNHLNNGGIAAIIFETLPKTWNGFKVYDADTADDLMLDIIGGGILGLSAKGKAKKDSTGFVVLKK